ncbi:MAG: PaaI family thioesterase [Desulfobacterales bacterium]|nr:PaaI family thioesterase [Desulfobacterales bacterium]
MNIYTHKKIDSILCGEPTLLEKGYSRVEFHATDIMKVDEYGLIHGGFVFGLADYSAMLAVNHPNVVLGSATVKFLKPVKAGDFIVAEGRVVTEEGKKQKVVVTVKKGEDKVFEGEFICFVLNKHVLE